MADDKERAEKLAAARKKAQKKAAEAKAKKGKAASSKEEAPAATDGAAVPEVDKEPETPTTANIEEATPTTEESPAAAAAAPPAVSSPSESTAALEAKLTELEKECADAKSARDEAQLMADALEKKVESLEMLHKEDESQIKRLESDLAEAKNDTVDLKNQLQKSEAEVLKLSKKEAQDSGGTDNDHLDELEDEERLKLEQRIRDLEAENTDLRRGIWHERRKDMQPNMEDGGASFTNVDLGGAAAVSPGTQRKQGGLGDFFTSGLNALTGAAGAQHDHDDDGFLDDDEEFDEDAFRKAQEEAAKARIERIKEVKRGLKNWEGWRLDLVEGRQGGGEGIGEIFEV